MLIYSWNVNGLRSVMKKGFQDWLNATRPDVLCLQETKVLPEQLDEAARSPDGFDTLLNPARRKGYSGVGMWYRTPPKAWHLGMGIDEFDGEGRVIRFEYPQFDLLNVYFPNGTSGPERLEYKMNFYDAFLEHCQDLRKQGKKLVICGDVNTAHCEIDLKNAKANEKNSGFLPEERAWIDRFLEHGYVDTFRESHPEETGHYTWWTYRANARARNIGWRIDYFFVTEDLRRHVKRSFIAPDVMGSDHCPIGLEIFEQE